MLRISTTTLDAFRKFNDMEFDDLESKEIAFDKFVKDLKRETPPSPYMLKGSEFHEIIEYPNLYLNEDFYKVETNKFSLNCISDCHKLIYENIDKNLVCNEIKATKIFNINNKEVELVAKADLLYGNMVIENKTVWSEWGKNGHRNFYNEFFSSLQWKCYIEIFEALQCKYNVFLLKERKKMINLERYETYIFEKNQYDVIEIINYLTDFVYFLEINDLTKILEK